MAFRFVLFVIILGLLSPLSVAAQSNIAAEDLDEIVVTGNVKTGDRAMSAFFEGDFETAEIEFEKNLKSIIRLENLEQNGFTQTKNSLTSQLLSNGMPKAGGPGGAAPTPVTPAGLDVSSLNLPAQRADSPVVSGTDKGFQLYMIGLSQIQLGKYDQAETSFKRAIRLNRKIYDARTRLGLLNIHNNDFDSARKQLVKLDKIRRRCDNSCKDKDEITKSTLILAKELSKPN